MSRSLSMRNSNGLVAGRCDHSVLVRRDDIFRAAAVEHP